MAGPYLQISFSLAAQSLASGEELNEHMNGFANPERMYLEAFGEVEIFRPRLAAELEVRAAAEKHLRRRFEVGIYSDKDQINTILQHNFAFYRDVLEEVIPQIASIHFLKFVLYQFEQYARVDQLQRNGVLNRDRDERWSSIGPNLRRGAKYLAERICFIRPDEAPHARQEYLLGLGACRNNA
jgi:hypothetical protein